MIDDAGLAASVAVDSAGTHDYHVGESPDSRSQQAAKKRGFDISMHKARQVSYQDYVDADLILAMDWKNLLFLQQKCPKVYHPKIMLLMRFSNDYEEATVPDPYYGGAEGFKKVLEYIQNSCEGVLELVQKRVLQYQAA